MATRRDHVEDLLYDGETVRETVDLAAGQVVVTSHRVLAFTPRTEGANFRQADLPNVEGVGLGAQTEADLLERALRFGVIGVVLLGFGALTEQLTQRYQRGRGQSPGDGTVDEEAVDNETGGDPTPA